MDSEAKQQKFPDKFDLYQYVGGVSMDGYSLLCEALRNKKYEHAILAITTPGGDPHAAFRIARALQHEYPKNGFAALVPGFCKSAGTLIVTGAKALYMADMSELGPLDVQVRKGDELFARNSGLEIFEAITFLRNQTLMTFRDQARALTGRDGLSTKTAADIAIRLTRGIFEPISAQIDPIRLAEMQRANDIMMAYGLRLAEVGKNLKQDGIPTLIGGYPSHGFVIDRKEARAIFAIVKEPDGYLLRISDALRESDPDRINMKLPEVRHISIENTNSSKENEHGSIEGSGNGSASPADGDAPIHANSRNAAEGQRSGQRQPSKGGRRVASTSPSTG